MSALERLFELADKPYLKTDERKLIAVFPMWFPYEMLIAAGLRAGEWWGFDANSPLADAHYPAYICTVVKSNFEVLLNGQAKPDGMVFQSSTCDSIQNAAGIFRLKFPDSFSAFFRMTQNPESSAAREYMRSELIRLRKEIGAYTGTEITDDDLRKAIAEVNDFRRAVRELLLVLAKGKPSVPAAHIYKAIRGALADIGTATAKLLDEVRAGISVSAFTGPKIMLVGMTAEPFDALDAFETAGGAIVGDDLGLGWRTMEVDAPTEGDPLDAIATRLLNAPACSSLHFRDKRRADYVLSRAKTVGAKGVVFTRLKFCDPEAFDYPDIKCVLDDAGIPTLLLERNITDKVEGTATTRIEAFLEQIG